MGNTIDLVFSNIPFVETVVNEDLWSSSDHMTLLTTIPTSEEAPPTIPKWKIDDDDLPMFTDLVGNTVDQLDSYGTFDNGDTLAIDQWLRQFNRAWDIAIKAAGREVRGGGHTAPWWTDECREAHRQW
jgi:hypothetical protein